jgi:isopentenyl diphosphate isomerase/L-lactate dehydrogenase-like FMN-dependent dehydrogenase
VVKALALGADAVMVGRATLDGVAAGGEAGAARALDIFRDEIHRVQALLGVHQLGQLGPQYLKLVDPTLRAPKYVRRPLQAVPADPLATASAAAEAAKPR